MSDRLRSGPAGFIWATRGRTWGFRFLRTAGLDDPLGEYEQAFSSIGDQPEAWCRIDDEVALRFPDPEGRQDLAGRVIPHDFVLFGDWAEGVDSLDAGMRHIWPEVKDEYADVWDHSRPPPTRS